MHPTTGAATPSNAFLLDVAVPTKNSLKNKSVVGNPAHKTSTSADDITFVGSSKPVDTIIDRRPHVHASTPHVALGTFNASTTGTRSSAPGKVASGHNAIRDQVTSTILLFLSSFVVVVFSRACSTLS
jgi:hypothetical protein